MIRNAAILLVGAILPAWAQNTTASPPTQVPPAPTQSLDDDPGFKSLSPEMQERVRQFMNTLNKAVAAEKQNGSGPQPEKQAPAPQSSNSVSPYVYTAAAPNTPPAKPTSPCEVAPKKTGLLSKLKKHAQQTLQKQAAKADAKVGTATKGNVDGGIQDTANTAIAEADKPTPCPPAKAKQ